MQNLVSFVMKLCYAELGKLRAGVHNAPAKTKILSQILNHCCNVGPLDYVFSTGCFF